MEKITILIVDNHPLIRKAWIFTLHQDPRFKVIGECENGEDGVEIARKLNPDIVIMDICMRGINGIQATKLMQEHAPGSKVIGLSFHIRQDYVHAMLKNGAMGYLTKFSSSEEIFEAITEVKNGRVYICNEVRSLMDEQ